MYQSQRLLSPRLRIRWVGWESDTYTLQCNGWEISAKEDLCTQNIRVAIHHPVLKLYGISEEMSVYHMGVDNSYERLLIDIVTMSSKLTAMVHNVDFNDFSAVDCTPGIVDFNQSSIEDFNIFRKIGKSADEIIVDPKSVKELMAEIIKKQTPLQQEITERNRKARLRGEMKSSATEAIETDVVYNIVKLAS